jgi:hypothetical protein
MTWEKAATKYGTDHEPKPYALGPIFDVKEHAKPLHPPLPHGDGLDSPEDRGALPPNPSPICPHEGDDESDPVADSRLAIPLGGAFTDSGYASASAPLCEKSVEETRKDDPKQEELDTRTVYSDEGSINGAELDTYKAELVDNLVKNVRLFQAESEVLEDIFAGLPSLLKAFALSLGQPGSTKVQKDVMYFIHKYRE